MSLRVAVIGAGVAGMTTAWELATEGHEVEIFDMGSAVAEGASFASTGCVGAASLVAWDFSGLDPVKSGVAGMVLPPTWARSIKGMNWLRQRIKSQRPDRLDQSFDAALTLAALTTERMKQSLKQIHTEVETTPSVLVLLRTALEQQSIRGGLDRLQRADVKLSEVDALAAYKLEPALNPDVALASAISIPSDYVLNGRQWLTALKYELTRLGVRLHLRTLISHLTPDGHFNASGVGNAASDQRHRFDAVVLCNGHGATKLLQAMNVELPLMVLNHCSVSAPVRDALNAPETTVIDAQQRILIARTGQRIRAASGTAVIPGHNAQSVFSKLYQTIEDWFPGATQLHGANALVQSWQHSCDHTPDGLPLVGPSGHSKIWMNIGHGGRGWTFAAGASRLLVDMLTRQAPRTDTTPYSPSRYQQPN
jgi:D-amino-acid dehydrogenase